MSESTCAFAVRSRSAITEGGSDPHTALGDRPDKLRARGAHDQTPRDVDAAQARLARDHTVDRASSRAPTRSHGLGR